MSLLLLIILVSGVFLVGGVTPKMHDDTLDMKTTGTVQGVQSGSTGSSFAGAPGTSNGSKKSLQMKQLILTTTTPTPIGPAPTKTPTPTTTSPSSEWKITYKFVECREDASAGNLELTGSTSGYTITEVKYSGEPDWTFADSEKFDGAKTKNAIILFPQEKPFIWRVTLFSGGTFTTRGSGGTLRATYDGALFTKCT